MDTPAELQEIGTRLGHRVTIKPMKGHRVYKWRATFVEGGKYRKKGFKTKVAAEKFSEERQKEALAHGVEAAISATERATVMDTRTDLASVSLSLRQAVACAVEYHRKVQASCTVAELVERSIASRKDAGLSSDHLKDLKYRLGKFTAAFGDCAVATVTKDQLEAWFMSLPVANATRNHYRALLVSIFNDALADGYADVNAAAKTRKAKVVETEVGILKPDEASALLTGADEAILPAIAVGLFAGLRDSEIKRLDWKEVRLDLGSIHVKASTAKTARNRMVPVSDNLKAWLQPHAKKSGSVWPSNGRKLMEAARLAAGFGSPKKVKEAEKKGDVLKGWPSNCLRHSFGTFHILHHKDAGALALELGHTDTKIIFKHYRNAHASAEEAATFWSIKPEAESNMLEMRS